MQSNNENQTRYHKKYPNINPKQIDVSLNVIVRKTGISKEEAESKLFQVIDLELVEDNSKPLKATWFETARTQIINDIKPPIEKDEEEAQQKEGTVSIAIDHLRDECQGSLEAALHFTPGTKEPFIALPENGRIVCYEVNSEAFKLKLTMVFWEEERRSLSSNTLNDLLRQIAAMAVYQGTQARLETRLAFKNGVVYVDLGTENRQIVAIRSDGWEIISSSDAAAAGVYFKNPTGQRPLPLPTTSAISASDPSTSDPLIELKKLLGLNDKDWRQVLACLVYAFFPQNPHSVLCIHGVEGSGKTTVTRALKDLIDPFDGGPLSKVRDERAMALYCDVRRVIAFENLSSLTREQSDLLCRLATGIGFTTRTLYKNRAEEFFEFVRPIIINGIDEVAIRGDLLRRAIIITLLARDEASRITEAEFNNRYELMKPAVLGRLFDLLSHGLKTRSSVKLDKVPSMADFAIFGTTLESAMGWPQGDFMKAYRESLQHGFETAVDEDCVALSIQDFMASKPSNKPVELSANNLLDALAKTNTGRGHNTSGFWPKDGPRLSKNLRRIINPLKGIGIIVEFDRRNGKRQIRLTKVKT